MVKGILVLVYLIQIDLKREINRFWNLKKWKIQDWFQSNLMNIKTIINQFKYNIVNFNLYNKICVKLPLPTQ